MTDRIEVTLWLQHPPRVEWVLRVRAHAEDRVVTVRTWLKDYGPSNPPPPCVTNPIAQTCAAIAKAALEGPALDVDFTVQT